MAIYVSMRYTMAVAAHVEKWVSRIQDIVSYICFFELPEEYLTKVIFSHFLMPDRANGASVV